LHIYDLNHKFAIYEKSKMRIYTIKLSNIKNANSLKNDYSMQKILYI